MSIDSHTNFISSFSIKKSKFWAAMHNAAYQQLESNFIYVPFAVKDIKIAIEWLKVMDFKWSAISMPYKQEVMQYLDDIDETAQTIGAVNTIVNKNGKLTGYNSDWIWAIQALKEVTPLEKRRLFFFEHEAQREL